VHAPAGVRYTICCHSLRPTIAVGRNRARFLMQSFESCRPKLRVLAISILECRCSNPAASASQSVSNASHMKVAQKPRGTARFLRYELVSVCGIWHGGAIPASCLRGPFFGVPFLVPYCPFGQACYPAVMIHDPIVGRLTSLLTHRGQQRLSPC